MPAHARGSTDRAFEVHIGALCKPTEVPFMEMESPRWASVRMEAQEEIVRVVPVVGLASRALMTELATAAPGPSTLPLAGIRALDMTRVLAGLNTDTTSHSAEVIKIEHPTRGDDTRAWGPPFAKHIRGKNTESPGESAYFLSVNRNKKSIGLSFASEAGQKILHSLAKTCDILVENYLPNTLKKYHMDFASVNALNPRLIYASITGYGQTGPYSSRAGYDVMVEAEMGLMHITGPMDGPPVKVGVAVTDLTTGLYTSNAIMAALIARGKTGKGQHIDVALSDCQVATLSNIASSALISGEPDSGRWGTSH
ncbi:MAG: hypothetical protein Q9212_007559, partial [Teloschistes hypoglaucus]